MLIGFSMCDGRHAAADKESVFLYRMYMIECACSIALRSPLRHRRRRSLVFVIIIADAYEKRTENRASKRKRQ